MKHVLNNNATQTLPFLTITEDLLTCWYVNSYILPINPQSCLDKVKLHHGREISSVWQGLCQSSDRTVEMTLDEPLFVHMDSTELAIQKDHPYLIIYLSSFNIYCLNKTSSYQMSAMYVYWYENS
jgi:hypothetical protein